MSTRLEYMDVPVAEVVAREGVNAAIAKKHVASVLYSYRCSLSCLHCCFNSSPSLPDARVPLAAAIDYLRQLHATDRCVHIAGGEAMLYWPELLEVCRGAEREGVAPHFIETNATWCVSSDVASERLLRLRDAGVLGLLISSDPYHQRECPPEHYIRCRDAALEVFGAASVAGVVTDEEARRNAEIARDPALLEAYARERYVILSARAGEELARFRPDRPIEDLALDPMWHGPSEGMDCRKEFEPEEMWEVHLDPYGNVQTCCGIILGNVGLTPLPRLWETGFLANPLVEAVHRDGPRGLLVFAVARGYRPRPGYPQKCNLCWEVRKFLRPFFPETFGPAEVYGG